MQLDTYNKLYQIAEGQAGYFTTAQAAAVGVDRGRLARYAADGRLERVRRGVYRLVPFPRTPHEDLFIAWLETGPDSVISHDSALALYDLSDALPATIHVTVSGTASRRHRGLRLHTNRLSAQEITHYDSLPVTTVPRTIADVALEGLAEELVGEAVREAIQHGLATPAALLAAAQQRGPRVAQMIRRALERAGQLPTGEVQG
jgi:predicted transcriptional regulator of viral defense system